MIQYWYEMCNGPSKLHIKKLYSQRTVKFWFSTNTDPQRIKNELTVDVYTLPISFGPLFLLFLHQFLVWSGEHSVTPFSHFLHSPVEAASLQLWVDCQKFVLTNYKPLSIVRKKKKNFLTYIQFHLKYINNIFAHEAHHLLEQHFQMIKKLDEQNFYHVSTMFQISF